MTKPAVTTGRNAPNPGRVRKPADVKTTGKAVEGAGAADGGSDKVRTADEKEALKAAAEKGASVPAGSDDKKDKGIQPAADPAQRIDEMTNQEAKEFSAKQNEGNAYHTADEDRPRGQSHLNPSTQQRTQEGEDAYREHYSRGWNDFNNDADNREDYRGGPVEPKDAYLAGWQGAKRESQLGHQGGDMKRGDFEKARVEGA